MTWLPFACFALSWSLSLALGFHEQALRIEEEEEKETEEGECDGGGKTEFGLEEHHAYQLSLIAWPSTASFKFNFNHAAL